MNKTKEKQPIPKWFNGEIYDEGAVVTNPFSGEEYELNNIELSMYDFVMGATMVYETKGFNADSKIVKDLRKGLDWFKQHNAKAYMVLLDQSMELTMTDNIMLEIHYVVIAYIVLFILAMIGTKQSK